MKVTIAQINPTIGDIEGTLKKMSEIMSEFGNNSDLIVFPELVLTGYPPRDFLEKQEFLEKIDKAIDALIGLSGKYPDTGVLFGAPTPGKNTAGKKLYNSAILVHNGKIAGVQHKSLLPVYDVFDETRYFEPAAEIRTIPFKDQKLGVSICEDMWNTPELWPGKIYDIDPIRKLADQGATLFINLSASPFHAGKDDVRYQLVQNHVKKYGVPFILANQVGANDELLFEGRSVFIDGKGGPGAVFPAYEEHIETVDTALAGSKDYKPQDRIGSVYGALVLGVRDYMNKCGFSRALVGLSGGIDSSVVCAIAKEAIGGENVLGISMPSLYSSKESMEYSRETAERLGVQFKEISISPVYETYIQVLKKDMSIAEEKDVEIYLQNIQARIRGNILMAFSNKYGYLLLTTGNKSELAVGYCTLYGDMAGGLAVISDVPKTMVYKLAGYINRENEVIPQKVIDRTPSAELKPGQSDQDTLPPYDILDQVLYYYLEEGCSGQEIVNKGFDPHTVNWIIKTVNQNEYKRRQAPPGLKVTTKAFGTGRRMPIAVKHGI